MVGWVDVREKREGGAAVGAKGRAGGSLCNLEGIVNGTSRADASVEQLCA